MMWFATLFSLTLYALGTPAPCLILPAGIQDDTRDAQPRSNCLCGTNDPREYTTFAPTRRRACAFVSPSAVTARAATGQSRRDSPGLIPHMVRITSAIRTTLTLLGGGI
ncbi:uncharacterized protein SCHCODRAFT_02624530 [Schizophyllum commune H4-8]|uniref:uncharacterized protein n=1 Tax=Schizophyllum commune (strain H4-8 / FGSC 9210) TaxID=578458 RepID=UPI0021607311|nr:uncharacterized protein SCHCODRAFT_02624530 [Schizophyllum commune H4-8]KAI5894393.1 hypothetical protein SCHCODRAFT_02624530 [Schizophyllum commune H4-8]